MVDCDSKDIKKQEEDIFKTKVVMISDKATKKQDQLWELDSDIYDVFGKDRMVHKADAYVPDPFFTDSKYSSKMCQHGQSNHLKQSSCRNSMAKGFTEPNLSEI